MLQRIQTIFLALVALCMLLMLFFPIWSGGISPAGEEMTLTAWKFTSGDMEISFPYTFIATLAIAAIIVAIIEISKYNNRLLQIKLGALNSLLMAGALGLSVFFYRDIVQESSSRGDYGIGLWLPAIAMIFNVIANRFIRKDEKLVRSADRIR